MQRLSIGTLTSSPHIAPAVRRLPLALSTMLLALLLGGCSKLYFGTLNVGGPSPQVVRGITYGQGQQLDLYLPAPSQRSAPVLVFFYGGRWQDGARDDYAFVGERLAARGVLTVVADYRQWPEVRFPAFVEDAAQAVGWAHANVAAHGGDPARIFVGGHSAGAHLAALLGTDARYLDAVGLRPAQLGGVIGIAGPYDFLPLTDDDLQEIFGPREGWPSSQPINFVDGDEPPFLLQHGDDDLLVWPRNSVSLQAHLQRAGVPVELCRYPDIGHIRILAALRYPALAPVLGDLLAFVDGGADAVSCGDDQK